MNSTTQSQFIQTVSETKFYWNVSNSSLQNLIPSQEDGQSSVNKRANFFIGLLVILVLLTAALIGVYFYGRRRRKWREFLAQLDNNTDWELEIFI